MLFRSQLSELWSIMEFANPGMLGGAKAFRERYAVPIERYGSEEAARELRRVTRGPIVVLTFDGDALDRYWLADYAAEMLAVERRRYPPIATLVETLGGACEVHAVPIPVDCVDGFSEAFYARPEAFLDPAVRRSQSAWSFVPDDVQARIVARLGADLASGEWDRRHGAWRAKPFFEGSLRGIVSRPPR